MLEGEATGQQFAENRPVVLDVLMIRSVLS